MKEISLLKLKTDKATMEFNLSEGTLLYIGILKE
jgi:hypothetical protein